METLNNLSNLEQKSRLEKILRNRWSWLLLIILADLISISWVSLDEAFHPLVFLFAGLGIVILFSSFVQTEVMVFIAIFTYLAFFIFLIFIKKIKVRYLYISATYFILFLILTLFGCSRYS